MSTTIARTRRSVTSWTIGGLGGWDVVAAAFLSALIIGVCVGLIPSSNHHVSAAATAGFLTMVAPVAWRRRSPLAVAAIQAVAALLNGLLAGPLVRCGETLPAIVLAAFAVGSKLDRRTSALGFLLCAASVAAEGIYDPRIGARGLVVTVPVMAAFFVVGRLVRARSETAEALRFRSAELRRKREQNARLAVIADREEISANIEQLLHAQIGGIAAAAAAGMAGDAAVAREALADIGRDGRHVLERMRGILGTLSGRPPGDPQPTLARLPHLLASTATVPSTASGLALSGGQFGLTAMRERVSACGGSLSVGPTQDGRWQVLAMLPANRRSAV